VFQHLPYIGHYLEQEFCIYEISQTEDA
jgi:hypothetical protein